MLCPRRSNEESGGRAMRNGQMLRADTDLVNLFVDIQTQRVEMGTDRKKKSLTRISRMVSEILSLNKNLNRLLQRRCK